MTAGADLYSLGVIGYSLLAGFTLYDGARPESIAAAAATGQREFRWRSCAHRPGGSGGGDRSVFRAGSAIVGSARRRFGRR
ncbi:MAG: hypothetical protein R2882_01045 [Gemmatimonadales bacterium]